MPETPLPTAGTTVSPSVTAPSIVPLKPFSQWKQESGTGSEIDDLVGYSNYQRVQTLKSGNYSADTEKQIQSALFGQIQKKGILESKPEEEREPFLSSLFDIPEPSFDDTVRAVTAAYPTATPDSGDPDLANFARFRDFGASLGDEVSQEQQDTFEQLKREAAGSVTKLYDKAQKDRVRAGDIPIAVVTNFDEKGNPYKDFFAGDLKGLTAQQAVAKAIESGAVPPQAAFAAYTTLETVPGMKTNQIGLRNIERVKDLARKASTVEEYTGLQDIVNDYGDYLADKAKGETDDEDELFANRTANRFATFMDIVADDDDKPTDMAMRQALEELAFDSAIQNGKIKFDEKDLGKNIRFSSAGVPLVHPALIGNSEQFEQALETNPDVTPAQKKQLQANRKTFLASNFDRYDDLLSESPTQGTDWISYRNKARAEDRDDFDILDSYLKNPNNFKEFSSRMRGIGGSILDSFGTLVATVPALAGADWAQDYLTETAKKNSARRQVAEAFGRPFGVGQDILEQIAPIAADLAATALLSAATGGVAGAGYLAARQGTAVTGKAVGKALTAGFLRRSLFMQEGETAAQAAARLTDVGDLIKKGTSVADAERVITGYNRAVSSKLNLVSPLFLTSANRSAGGMYGAVYNSLPNTLSKEDRHDQALGAALLAGATTGVITSAFSLAGLGGLENVLLKGATVGQLRKVLNSVGGSRATRDITNADFRAALVQGMKDTFAKLGLTKTAQAKALGVSIGSEAAEEGIDEFIQTFVNDAFTGSDTPILKKLQQGLHAAFIGGVFGGAIPGIKAAVKNFTPTTAEEARSFAGARSELAQSVASRLEASGSPLSAQAINELLTPDVVQDVFASSPGQVGASSSRFAGMTRAEVVNRLMNRATAPAEENGQLLMGSVLEQAEGTAPPTPSPLPAGAPAAAPAEGGSVPTIVTPPVPVAAAPSPTPAPEEPGDPAVVAAAAAAPTQDFDDAFEAELTQSTFDFFDDASAVRTAVTPRPASIEGIERGLPSLPTGVPAPANEIQQRADELFDNPQEAAAYRATLNKNQQRSFNARIELLEGKEEKLNNSRRKAVSQKHKAPTVPLVQDAVNTSGVLETADNAGVTVAFVDGAKEAGRYVNPNLPAPPADRISFVSIRNGVPVVVVNQAAVRGKTADDVAESVRQSVLHASVVRAAAETGAYTDTPSDQILEEGGLFTRAVAIDPTIKSAVSPAETLSRVLYAIGDSQISLDLNEHPLLRSFIGKVLPKLNRRIMATGGDPSLRSYVENFSTLLQEGEILGSVVPEVAPTPSPASPRLQPRILTGEDQTLTEDQKDIAAKLFTILLDLNAIPRNLPIIFDFTPTKERGVYSFKVEGGFMYVNPMGVVGGLIKNNLMDNGRIIPSKRAQARRVLKKELTHEQIHMAIDRALTVEEKQRLFDGYTTEELVDAAAAYLQSDPKFRDKIIEIIKNPSHPEHTSQRIKVAEEKFRADVQNLMNGETSEDVLAELSNDAPRKKIYEKYLTKARYIFRKKLRSSGDPFYAVSLKRAAQALRDMQNGYIPVQHSHGGIFSPDRPYAGLAQIMRAEMRMAPGVEGPDDIDVDEIQPEPGAESVVVPPTGEPTLTPEESDNVNLSMFGAVDVSDRTVAETKAKVLGGTTVGTRYSAGATVTTAEQSGTNPENQITLEAASVDKPSYYKNALILISYPGIRGLLRKALSDPDKVRKLKEGMSDKDWKATIDKINKIRSSKIVDVFNRAEIYKSSEPVVKAIAKRDNLAKEVRALVDVLSSSQNPTEEAETAAARDAYWLWFFRQIRFTGKGVITPAKFQSSSYAKTRDAIVRMVREGTMEDFNNSYEPPAGAAKWTPSLKELNEIVKKYKQWEVAKEATNKINAKTKTIRDGISKELTKIAANKNLMDDRVAGVLYGTLTDIGEFNLKALHDIFPESVRHIAKLWYDGANIIARQLAGATKAQTVNGKNINEIPDLFGGGLIAKPFAERALEKAAAILAVFSPQKDWFMNVSLAHRTMHILNMGFARPESMVWTEAMSARFISRAGEPEEIEQEDGSIKYTGGAIPVWADEDETIPKLDDNGNRVFLNWDKTDAKQRSINQARKISAALKGKTFMQIGSVFEDGITYEYADENGDVVTTTLDSVSLQARFVRMYSEVNHKTEFPVVTPHGNFGGPVTSPKSGKQLKLAWGGYNTIEKAIRIYTAKGAAEDYKQDLILRTISDQLGGAHKVRSFYNNIVNPEIDGHVTMDTHAIAALLGKPLSGAMDEVSHNFGTKLVGGSRVFGVSGLYAGNAEAYRNVAGQVGLLARELQSITWESVRLLFPAEFKRGKGVAEINDIWNAFDTGDIDTLDQVWDQILQVVWKYTRKGATAPTLEELRTLAQLGNVPTDAEGRAAYNGLGFPSWDTAAAVQNLIETEGVNALEDIDVGKIDVGNYLDSGPSVYSAFGAESDEAAMMALQVGSGITGKGITKSSAALRRAIENMSTRIEGTTSEEILREAVVAKLTLALYGYHGSKLAPYSDYMSYMPVTGLDPLLQSSRFDPVEPNFVSFFEKAPTLRNVIRTNPYGFTVNSDAEKQLVGYVVAPRKETEKRLSSDFTDDDLRAYIVENADILSLPGARLGGWFDDDNQTFILDVSFPLKNTDDALTVALAADQDAIWDLQNEYGIRTKNPDGTATLPRVIDGRDAQQVLTDVVPTLGDVAIFASERAYRDTGRMGLPSDGGPETAGAAARLDVPTSRIIAEAREVNLSDAAPGGTIQGGFGRVTRKGRTGESGYLTGRFRKIPLSKAREMMKGAEYKGAEHYVKADRDSTSRVFKVPRHPSNNPFGLVHPTVKHPQSGYLSRIAFTNIFFEDNARIEAVVEDEKTGDIMGYLTSQPFYSKSRNLSNPEIVEILSALGWLRDRKHGKHVYLSKPVRLKDGTEGPRLFITDAHSENIFMENTADGGEILRAPDIMVGLWSDDQAVRDKFPSVAELLEEHPDPAEYGISVPSQLDGIIASDLRLADDLKKLRKEAEDAQAQGSGWLFSAFGAPLTEQDNRYLKLAQDPVKNKEALQRMVDEAAKRAGYTVAAGHKSKNRFTKFDRQRIGENDHGYAGRGFYFTPDKPMSGASYGREIYKVFLKLENPYRRTKDNWNTDENNPYSWIANRGQALEQEGVSLGLGLSQALKQASQEWTDQRLAEGYDGFVDEFGSEIVIFDAINAESKIKSADPVTYDEQGNVIPLSQRFNPETPDIRYSAFGTGDQVLLDQVFDFSTNSTSYFDDLFDVLEFPVFESGTYKRPSSFLSRLAIGEFDPRYTRLKQTQRAFSVAAASFIEQEREALQKEVEDIYGSSKDPAANALISRAFGSTDLPVDEETTKRLREAHKERLIAARRSATPEAVQERAQVLVAGGREQLDAEIEARNAIIEEAVAEAKKRSFDEEVKVRKEHADRITRSKNDALRKLEQQAPLVKARVLRIRSFVDEQSRRIRDMFGEDDPLRIVIDNQLGIYVTRSYKFFNDEGFKEAILNPDNRNYSDYEDNRRLARQFFEQQYLEDRTAYLMETVYELDEDAARRQAVAELEGRSASGKSVGEEMMLKWLDGLSGGPVPEPALNPQGRDDFTIRVVANNLKQRKSVPEPLRRLLGEESGIEGVLRTAAAVSAIHASQKTLSNIYRLGRSDKQPENRWLLTKDEYDALDYTEQRKYSSVPVKNMGASVHNPVAGHYAPVEFTAALQNLSTKQGIDEQTASAQTLINGAMDAAVKATGFSMAFNVLLSVGHFFRNIIGYVPVAVAVGRPSLILKSVPSLGREAQFLLPTGLRKVLDMPEDKFNAERLRLVALNIDNDSVRAGTLRDMLAGRSTISDIQEEMRTLTEKAKSLTGKALQPIMDKLSELEATTETFFKIAYFYDTLEVLRQAKGEDAGSIGGVPLSALSNESALYKEAARQTLMVLPSHSQTMPVVTEFTKSGFGLMLAPFLRWKSEMIRTPINNLKLATDEILSGNSVLQKRGIARISGMLTVLSASAALPAIVSSVLGGLDKEDDEALRKSMPKYLRDHSFFYFNFDGQIRSVDLTYVNPYSGIGDALNMFYRSAAKGDPMAPVTALGTFFQNNFLDDQILYGAIAAARENRDPTTGLPIYEDVDSPAVKALKWIKFVGVEAYGPRVITDMIKVIAASKEGQNSPGYEVKDIMLNGVMPFRIHTLDLPQQFRRYMYEHQQQYQRANNKLNVLLAKQALSPESVVKAYDDSVHYKKLANEDLLRTALAFTRPDGLGLPLADADMIMRDAGVSKQRIANLNNRVMDKSIPSKEFIDKLLQRPEGKERGQILYGHIQRLPRFMELDVNKR